MNMKTGMCSCFADISRQLSTFCSHYLSRKHRPTYETIALTPRKYWSATSGGHHSATSGWFGEPETNIPALLFPKHVLGLHASDDLAFHRDFEAVHTANRRLMNNGNSNGNANGNNGSNGNAYPDILHSGGNRDLVNFHAPLYLDGWQSQCEYVAVLSESPFTMDNTWKLVWDQKVTFIVTLLTSVAKVIIVF